MHIEIFKFVHGWSCMSLPFSIHMAGHVHNTSHSAIHYSLMTLSQSLSLAKRIGLPYGMTCLSVICNGCTVLQNG